MIREAVHQIDDAVDRVLIVSDLHSFAQPLDAFEQWRAGLSDRVQIVFNGDNFHGGMGPVETTQWIMEHAGPLATLGNHDDAMLACSDDALGDEPAYTEAGAYQLLNDEQRDYFRSLPHRLELTWRGLRMVVMHGHLTPSGGSGSYRWPPQTQREHFVVGDADLYALGHTHYAYVQESNGHLLANSGSMAATILAFRDAEGLHPQSGRSTIEGDDPRSSFLSVTESEGRLNVEIVRFDYDRDAAVAELEAAGRPNLEVTRGWLEDGVIRSG